MNKKIHKTISLILIFILTVTNLLTTFALSGIGDGTGNYVSTGGARDGDPKLSSFNASLVSFSDKDTYKTYVSFIVAGDTTTKNTILKSRSFIDNRNGMLYSKPSIIENKSPFKDNFVEPSAFTWAPEYIIVDSKFPQVAKKGTYYRNPRKAVEWALKTDKDGTGYIETWFKSKIDELKSLGYSFDKFFSQEDIFSSGKYVITVEPIAVMTNAPTGKFNITTSLTSAQMGIYNLAKLSPGTGGTVRPTALWDSYHNDKETGGTKNWSGSYAPFITTELVNSSILTKDSVQSPNGDSKINTLNIPFVDSVKQFETDERYTKNKKHTPRTMVDYGGIWIVSMPEKDPYISKNLQINQPKTDFQVEEPEVISFNEKIGEIELSVKGGYHPINEEYKWRFPEINNNIFDIKTTTRKDTVYNPNNNNIPNGTTGVTSGFDKDSVTVGNESLFDAVMASKTLSEEEMQVIKEIQPSAEVKSYFGDDDSIKVLTNQTPSEFSIKLESGRVTYPGIKDYLNKELSNLTDGSEKSRTTVKKVTDAISSAVLEQPTKDNSSFPESAEITYEDFRSDDRLKLEVFIYDDMGNYITHYEKHIADVAKDNNITGSEVFEKYTPMNLVKNTGEETIKFELDPQKYKEANSLVITSRINWIDPKEQKSHYYKNDEYLKRSETLPNLADDGLGWTNNLRQTIVEIPKPNLVATSIIPTVNYETEKLCIEAEGLIEKISTPTISTTHTVSIYKMTTSGYELVKEHIEELPNVKQGDVVKFNNGQWCTGIDVPKNSTQKYYVVYEINKPKTQPDNEETYWDNKVDDYIDIVQGINWTATDVIGKAVNKQPNNPEYFEYDLTINGTGVLSSLVQDGKTSINAQHDLYISFDTGSNKNWTKIASTDTGKKMQGYTTHLSAKSKTPIKVEANKSKIIFLKYCINEPKISPKNETIDNDNCVTNTITLPGPIPDDQKIGFPNLSCTFTIGQSDTKFLPTQAGVFREMRPIDEQYGRLVNIRYTGSESPRWRSCGICYGEWVDEYGEEVHNHLKYGIDGKGQASNFQVTDGNGVHDNLEQYHKGSTYYTTRYFTGNPPTKDPKDTIYKYKNRKTLDLNMSAQTIRYYEQRSQSVADCHCDDCECDPCTCSSTEYWTVALNPVQEKEFVIRFDEEYTYDMDNSRTYSTEVFSFL